MEIAAMDLRAPAGDEERASRMLHDSAYHQAKAAIMRPIAEVNVSVDRRTRQQVAETSLDANLARAAFRSAPRCWC
jgi:uncharacterized protein HemY